MPKPSNRKKKSKSKAPQAQRTENASIPDAEPEAESAPEAEPEPETEEPEPAPKEPAKSAKKPPQPEPPAHFLAQLREFGEALALAFIVAMFFRSFVVELFRIPSGSMSPTLIGDYAAEIDVDGDGELDQVVLNGHPRRGYGGRDDRRIQVFYRIDGEFQGFDNFYENGLRSRRGVRRVNRLSEDILDEIFEKREARFDRILVNKFYYWTRENPDRGDIMVFKVPDAEGNPFDPKRPIYIKRVAATEGERVRIDDEGDLHVNGEKVEEPHIHDRIFYTPERFSRFPGGGWYNSHIDQPVPEDTFLAFGDNSTGSLDSRAWGPVPVGSLKGLAIFRYFPFAKWGYINEDT